MDTHDDPLASTLDALLREEADLAEVLEAAADQPPDLSAVADAVRRARDRREAAARALLAALRRGGAWTLRQDGRHLSVTHDPGAPARSATSPDAAALAALAAKFAGEAPAEAPPPGSPDPTPLAWLPRPEPIDRLETLRAWVTRYERAVGERAAWVDAPRPAQHAAVTLLAALGRHLQDDGAALDGSYALRERIAARFPELSRFAATERPGFVHGLALEHAPRRGSWVAEACAAWDELFAPDQAPARARAALDAVIASAAEGADDATLRALTSAALGAGVSTRDRALVQALAPRLAAFHGCADPLVPTLRNRLREHLARERTEAEADDARSPIPADWAWRARTSGLRVLALGGDDREDVVDRWTAAFGFGEVVWHSGWNLRRVQSAAERIRNGTTDLVVIVRRFVTHGATDQIVPACKDSGVPFVRIDSGYGVNQLRLAIERDLSP